MCGAVSRKHKLYTLLKENPPHMRGCIYKKANMITGKKGIPRMCGAASLKRNFFILIPRIPRMCGAASKG